MNDTLQVNYIKNLKSPYQVGYKFFKYIGQIKICHIEHLHEIEYHFRSFIRDLFINNKWSLDYNLVIMEKHRTNTETYAFLTCRNNQLHEEVIAKLDAQVYYSRRLAVKPSGFTNDEINKSYKAYTFMRFHVNEFNEKIYPEYTPFSGETCNSDEASKFLAQNVAYSNEKKTHSERIYKCNLDSEGYHLSSKKRKTILDEDTNNFTTDTQVSQLNDYLDVNNLNKSFRNNISSSSILKGSKTSSFNNVSLQNGANSSKEIDVFKRLSINFNKLPN